MKKIPSGFLNAQTDSATGFTPVDSGLCTTSLPASSATFVVQKLVNRRGRPGGERKNDGLKRPSYGRGLTNKRLMSSGMAGPSRRGAVTIVALVVLMILAGLIAQQVSRALSDRRHSRQQVLHMQTEKLAAAGLDLAATSHAADPTWTGMTWKIPAGSIHQTNTAEVTIKGQDGTCTVVSRYPANNEIPYQVTRTRKLTP
jgi:hypothetical protein